MVQTTTEIQCAITLCKIRHSPVASNPQSKVPSARPTMPFVEGPTQSQRSQELRKYVSPRIWGNSCPCTSYIDPIVARRFFAPSKDAHGPSRGFNAYIEDDAALASFAETAAWRFGAQRAMIRLGRWEQ